MQRLITFSTEDAGRLEQRLAHGTLDLALTPQRELAVVHKAGGVTARAGGAYGCCAGRGETGEGARGLVGRARARGLVAEEGRGAVKASWGECVGAALSIHVAFMTDSRGQ